MRPYYVWNCDKHEMVKEWFMTNARSRQEALEKVLRMQHQMFDKEDWHDVKNYVVFTHEELEIEFGDSGVVYFQV